MTTNELILNPPGQPFTLSHRLVLEENRGMVRPSCACGGWQFHGYIQEPMAHALFARHTWEER